MAIYHQCACGARIKLPDTAAGRKARCRKCHAIFVVPLPAAARVPAPPPTTPAPPPVTRDPQPALSDEDLLDFEANSEPAPDYRFTRRPPPVKVEIEDSGDSRISSFWSDLVKAFFFFTHGSNLISLLVIVFCHFWLTLMSFGGIVGSVGSVLVSGYLCAFYFSIVLETASGEDDLPTVRITDPYDDLIRPFFLFLGTWLVALLPLLFVLAFEWIKDVELSPEVHLVLGGVGCLFWPAIVLMVAIGGGFSGLWPQLIIRTALSAPIAYLAVCVTLAVAAAIVLVPQTDLAILASSRGSFGGLVVMEWVLSAYGMIVSMRAIGLYYRHCKHKFPWSAE